MFRGCVLFAVFHVISAQGNFPRLNLPDIPRKCIEPPLDIVNPNECCEIPPFFSDQEFAECGFQKLDDGDDASRRRGPPDCSKQLCMLKKYELLKEDEILDEEAIEKFLDNWVEKNEEFEPAVEAAKERCIGKHLFGPPQICEANKLVFCISSTIFDKCPIWQNTERCTNLRAHMEECRPHFPSK